MDRFIIAGTPRSGSTWLHSALGSHPMVDMQGEVLHNEHFDSDPAFAADPWGWLQAFWNSGGKPKKAFKMFFTDCWEEDFHPEHRHIWDLIDGAEVGFVFLTRENLLALWVSMVIAQQTGVWNVFKPREQAAPAVALNVATLERRLSWYENGMARMVSHFSRHPAYHLTYEGLFSDLEGHLRQIQDFVGLQPKNLNGYCLKMETRPLSESITNYDEVALALKGTRFERFL